MGGGGVGAAVGSVLGPCRPRGASGAGGGSGFQPPFQSCCGLGAPRAGGGPGELKAGQKSAPEPGPAAS